MRNWLAVSLLLFLWLFSQLSLADPPKEEVTIVDDGWVEVPLDFTFPFYGNNYVTSFMFSNGVIGFLDPLNIPGTGIQNDGLCCNSYDFTTTAYGDMGATYGGDHDGVRFDYVIMPWHTDLIDIGTGKFYIQGDATFQSYFWENISEYYDQTDLNTFDTTIYPLGNIRFSYQAVDVQSHSVTVAIVGDLSAGEYNQWFYNNPSTDGGVYWTSGTQLPMEIEAGQSICEVDSTASYVCLYYAQGYAEAVYAAGCAASALYDSGCAGYAAAYLSQQCGISSLYSPSCSGYETAYIDNQCTLDPLYSPSCAGYSAATAEEEAEASYEEEEFEEDWEEYATFEPETSFDDYFEFETFDFDDFSIPTDTFDTGFEPEFEDFDTSFEEVFAELEMEMMEEFEDFSMDTFGDTVGDMEFDMPDMEDFEEFEVFEDSFEEFEDFPEMEMPEPEMEMPEETLEEPEVEEPEMEPELEPEPEEVLDEPSEEAEEETEPEPEEEVLEEEEVEDEQDDEQEEEVEEEDEGSADEESDEEVAEEPEEESEEEESEETMMAESEEEEAEEVVVAEAEVEELTPAQKKKAKEKKMREIITAKLNSLAKEMGEAASLAEQKELQSFIIALLNFNIGFNSYNSSMIDGTFYDSRDIYKDKKVPENQRGLRNGLANEILHNKLVDIQYEEGYGRSRI